MGRKSPQSDTPSAGAAYDNGVSMRAVFAGHAAPPSLTTLAMALTATVYHFRIELSDVDRGVYEALDLRPALHPSETLRYLLTRVLAYALSYEEGIALCRGLSFTEEPAVWVRHPDGRVALWIDVGRPSIERLHKASKAAERVRVFTHEDPELLRREARGAKLHRGEDIEVWRVDPALLAALEEVVARNTSLGVVHTEGTLYVTVGGRTLEGALSRAPLVDRAPG